MSPPYRVIRWIAFIVPNLRPNELWADASDRLPDAEIGSWERRARTTRVKFVLG